MSNKGRLYIVATPIGNLKDFTFRAIDTLQEVDHIFAEDTRKSIQLMKHYDITTNLDSYHEHNTTQKIPKIIRLLNEGKNIGLISYGLATLVAVSRMNDNKHYLSDVIFGAGLGMAVGRAFAKNYQKFDETNIQIGLSSQMALKISIPLN